MIDVILSSNARTPHARESSVRTNRVRTSEGEPCVRTNHAST